MIVYAAACTADGKGITYNEHINVAVAVTMPDGGLITPVIKVCPTSYQLLAYRRHCAYTRIVRHVAATFLRTQVTAIVPALAA